MTQPNLLELARQGDPHAIATLMNRSLQPRGMTATVERQGDRLLVALEAEQVPNRQVLTTFVQNGIQNLRPQAIHSVEISAHQVGTATSAWTQELVLEPPVDGVASEAMDGTLPQSEPAAPPQPLAAPSEPLPEPEPETITSSDYYPTDLSETGAVSPASEVAVPLDQPLDQTGMIEQPDMTADQNGMTAREVLDELDDSTPTQIQDDELETGAIAGEPYPNVVEVNPSAGMPIESRTLEFGAIGGDRTEIQQDDITTSAVDGEVEAPPVPPTAVPIEAELVTPPPHEAIDPNLAEPWADSSAPATPPISANPIDGEVVSSAPVPSEWDSPPIEASIPSETEYSQSEFAIDDPNAGTQEPVSVEFFDLDSSSSDYHNSTNGVEPTVPIGGVPLDPVTTDRLDDEPDAIAVPTSRRRRRFPLGLVLALLVVGGWIVAIIGAALWTEFNSPQQPTDAPSPEAAVPPETVVSNAPIATSPNATSAANAPESTVPTDPAEALEIAATRASTAESLAQAAQSIDDWRLVSSQWQQAIDLLEAVPSDSPDYAAAQQRLATYRSNLATAAQRANQPIPSVAAAPATTITVSEDISCPPVERGAESAPVELTNVQFSQEPTGAEELYLVGCITNHTDAAIAALNVNYRGASADNPDLLSSRTDSLTTETLNPNQTVPFRSSFTLPATVSTVTIDSLVWTPSGASEPQQVQAAIELNRDS
jgi:hypothetical protein